MADDLEFEDRMSDSDALMWSIEKDPLLRSTITAVVLLDGAPDRERFRRRMERASRAVPRLRQRVLGHPYSIAPPRWELDPNFDLDFHLRWVRAAGEGTLREVLDIAEPIGMQGFDRARPLWEFTVVEGLEDGRAAMIQKVHHSITDGIGGVELQLEVVDLERSPEGDPDADLPPGPPRHDLSETRRMRDALAYETQRQMATAGDLAASILSAGRDAARDPVGVARRGLRMASSTARLLRPATAPLSPVMSERSLSVDYQTLTVDLPRLKRAARTVAGKLNDAFVAGVAGGLRRYHEHHGAPVEYLRMTMPINVRDDRSAAAAGNHFVPARFEVPVGLEDPLALMTAVQRVVDDERAEPALSLSEPIAGVLNRLPTTATTALFGAMLKGIDFVSSNVPGAPFPLYIAGAKVEAQFAFGPMTGSAANITLLSYLDDLNIGVNLDPAAIPDADVFMACLRESFDEITKLG